MKITPISLIRQFANSPIRQLPRLVLAAVLSFAACGEAIAAVPLRWTVETSRAQPAVFEAYHGESLDLAATLQSYGKPVEIDPQAEWHIYWQTNGMADAWWSAPVPPPVPGRGVVTATFTPAMDPGAPAVNGFIGSPGNNYRAAFTIRFRHAPGATPNTLTKPVPILDLANTTVINAPWPTDETIAAEIRRVIDEDGISAGVDENEVKGIVTNTVDKAYVEGLGISSQEQDPTWQTDKDLLGVTERPDGTLGVEYSATARYASTASSSELANFAYSASSISDENGDAHSWSEIDGLSSDVQSAYAWSQNVYRYMTANTNAWFAGTNYVTNAQQDALRHKFAFEAGMDLSVVPCSMALWEIRDGEKVCVWDQRDWDSWYWSFKRQQLLGEIDPKIDAKADKAWSHHTATGIDNPAEDTVWLDTPKVVLSAGYAWQRNQTTRGSFFTLVNRGGLTSVGSNRDGSYFEIKDDEGNSIFKISKTDSYMADADAASVHVEDSVTLTVNYQSNVQPVAYCCTDLAARDFKEETDPDCPATIVWSHSGSTYTVRATPKVPDGKLFLFAKVRVEGQTKNEFAAPVEFQKIVIGGVTYTVGTATINGNTVLTLTR